MNSNWILSSREAIVFDNIVSLVKSVLIRRSNVIKKYEDGGLQKQNNSVSVCMATYNGELYVVKQLRSALEQLGSDDEIVVVDDCSVDSTVELIKGLDDKRIRIFVNDKNRREVYSFSRAISLARNDYIFLADQDDLWKDGRVELMKTQLLNASGMLLTSNFEWMDSDEKKIYIHYDGVKPSDSARWLHNIVEIFIGKTNYFGCAMAFRRELVPLILPIPDYIESHDLWIAMAANLIKSNVHLSESTLRKRKHDSNTTSTVSNRSLYFKLRARAYFVLSIFELNRRRRLIEKKYSHSGTV